MKTKVVVFTPIGVRILTNPTDAELQRYTGLPQLVNPDQSPVAGLPLQYWKLENGKLASMTEDERSNRDELLKLINKNLVLIKSKKKSLIKREHIMSLISFLVGLGAGLYF